MSSRTRVDLVSAGYDAGIQFGEYIAQDMVAVRVSPDLRPAVVGAPVYFESHPKPASPRDVLNHRCIRFRHRGESVYKWELDKGEESLTIAVNVLMARSCSMMLISSFKLRLTERASRGSPRIASPNTSRVER